MDNYFIVSFQGQHDDTFVCVKFEDSLLVHGGKIV